MTRLAAHQCPKRSKTYWAAATEAMTATTAAIENCILIIGVGFGLGLVKRFGYY